MAKKTIEFEETHHILEVDGVEYEVRQRTPKIMEEIANHDKKVGGTSEFESNMDLLSILFGAKEAKAMFPKKESVNLDKLALCVKYAMALFLSDYTANQNESLKETLKELDPALNALDKVSKAVNTAEMKKFVSKKKK